eukprot:5599534-Prymnesium_polylepis.1
MRLASPAAAPPVASADDSSQWVERIGSMLVDVLGSPCWSTRTVGSSRPPLASSRAMKRPVRRRSKSAKASDAGRSEAQ